MDCGDNRRMSICLHHESILIRSTNTVAQIIAACSANSHAIWSFAHILFIFHVSTLRLTQTSPWVSRNTVIMQVTAIIFTLCFSLIKSSVKAYGLHCFKIRKMLSVWPYIRARSNNQKGNLHYTSRAKMSALAWLIPLNPVSVQSVKFRLFLSIHFSRDVQFIELQN